MATNCSFRRGRGPTDRAFATSLYSAGCPPGGMVDAADLKSAAFLAWGFESPGGHGLLNQELLNQAWAAIRFPSRREQGRRGTDAGGHKGLAYLFVTPTT